MLNFCGSIFPFEEMSSRVSNRLREIAGMISCSEVSRESIYKELRRLADQVQLSETPFLTVTQASKRWGIDRGDIYKLIRSGEIEATEIAGRLRIDCRKVDAEML